LKLTHDVLCVLTVHLVGFTVFVPLFKTYNYEN